MSTRVLWAAAVLLLLTSPARADIHDEFRACRYDILPKMGNLQASKPQASGEQFCLGYAYWRGERSLKKDPALAAHWLAQAAQQGHPGAQATLGTMLRLGQGVEKNPVEAVKWYRRAADEGDSRAQAQLGFSYEFGVGVPENWKEAAKWCTKSGAEYNSLGLYCLGRMYQFGIGVPQNRKKAIELFDLAEDQNEAQAGFFARWLRTPENCIGYRNEWEREHFLFVCAEPKGIEFSMSKQRNGWLGQRLAELEAQASALRRSMSDYGKGSCEAAGGSFGGGGCGGDGGRIFNPGTEDRYGRPLW